MSRKYRLLLSTLVPLLSISTLAFLVVRGYDPHWAIVLLWCSLTGTTVGFLLGNKQGAFVGTIVGWCTGAVFIPIYAIFWMAFNLPPYPEIPF